MGGLFGGTMKAGKPQYTGIQVQTSASTLPVPIAWGMNRMAPNLMWYGDFRANKQKQKAGKGGGQKQEYYTYSASLQMGLCEGQIVGINKVYINQSEQTEASFASTGYTLFTGSDPQAPWGYLTSRHPNAALAYPGVAYLAIANYDLGQAASLPQHNFEVKALRYDTAAAQHDADPAIIIDDFLTNPQFGAGLDPDQLDYDQLFSTANAATTGDDTFQTYCRAMGFGMSPVLSSQEQGTTVIDRWARLMNSAIVWSGEKLKFIPYGDRPVTGNGVKYVPNVTIRYRLTDDDYILGDEGSDPVTMVRSDPADSKNSLTLEINDRQNQYNSAPVDWRDPDLVEKYGLNAESSFKASEITDLDMASTIVSLMGQRMAYIRNEFSTTVSSAYILLEPMDVITIYDPAWGEITVRIKEINENEEGELDLVLEDYPEGVASSSGFNAGGVDGGGQNQAAEPGPVNTPIIFEPPLALTNGTPQIWAAVSGGNDTVAGEFWGGAFVWLSLDGVTYQQVGTIDTPARMGVLSAALSAYPGVNPDNANPLMVNVRMSEAELVSVSPADASNYVTLCYVGGELLSFQNALLSSTFNYQLTTLYRGLYGTSPSGHLVGEAFARLDESIFRYDLPVGYIGETVYVKFQSFNLWGNAVQDLADCDEYTFTPTGGGVPSAPTGLNAYPGLRQNSLIWDEGSAQSYNVYAYHGTSTNFADATFLRSSSIPSFTHLGLADTDTWTYWVTAVTIGGESLPSSPKTVTTVTP